jgi:salicylate hydroxylase
MRQIMFNAHHPKCQPSYAHKFAFRSLVPMDRAEAALGHYKTSRRIMYMCPDVHALTFPVANGAMMNVVAFVTDPNPWPGEEGKFTAPATKSEAMDAFATSGPTVQTILSLLPEELDKWAIFDMYHHPVPSFAQGRACLAGDAAHASSPHHGAGAGCGIEDSLALAELLAKVNNDRLDGTDRRAGLIQDALTVYNQARYERAQWLVQSSRIVGNMYEWQDPDVGNDPEKFVSDFAARCHRIWDFDVGVMVSDALSKLAGKRSTTA